MEDVSTGNLEGGQEVHFDMFFIYSFAVKILGDWISIMAIYKLIF